MSDRMLAKKNVVGYGPGIKRVAGKKTGQVAMLFFVEKKTNDISDEDRVPPKFKHMVTDVIEVGKISPRIMRPCSLDVMSKVIVPLRGALTIGHDDTWGTLGAIIKDSTTGKLLAMTNAHVAGNPLNTSYTEEEQIKASGYTDYTRGPTAAGLKMYQPYPSNGNQFGEVYKDSERYFSAYNRTDVSLITIKSEFGVTPGIMGLTIYAQPFVHPSSIPVGTEVLKSGRTSGVTRGEILSMSAVMSTDFGPLTMTYENQIVVSSDDTEQVFLDYGDSGSALCVDLGNDRVGLIGCLWGGTDVSSTGSIAVASRLDDIVNEFDVAPWRGEIITKSSYPEVVSTPFGAVFTKDSTTFLSRTNDTVCEGSVCGLIVFDVDSPYHRVESRDYASPSSDITIDVFGETAEITCDATIEVEIEAEAYGGMVADGEVLVKIECDGQITVESVVSCDAEVVAVITSDVELVALLPADMTADATALVEIEGDASLVAGALATADATVVVKIDSDSEFDAYGFSTITADASVRVEIEGDAVMTADVIDFNPNPDAIDPCDSTNADALYYGAA